MEGVITVTDKRGGIILVANIWTCLLVRSLVSKFGIGPENIRVYIDGEEIEQPEAFKDDT